jgi:putative hydrolase of the HAD superfamily
MAIHAITLDFWDTIFKLESEFDPKTFRLEKTKFIISQFKNNFSDEQLLNLYNDVWNKFDKEWYDNCRTLTTVEIIGYILEKIDVTIPQEQFDSLVTYFQEAILENPPGLIDGSKEAIINLSKNYKLGIISDTGFTPGRVLKKILKMNDLLKYFSVLIFSDEFGKSKPHPDTFLYAMKILGVNSNELVHIGDNERTDVMGALSIDAKAILFTKGINGKSRETKANSVLEKWADVENVLKKL